MLIWKYCIMIVISDTSTIAIIEFAELQNRVKNSLHTSEPANELGSYTIDSRSEQEFSGRCQRS